MKKQMNSSHGSRLSTVDNFFPLGFVTEQW